MDYDGPAMERARSRAERTRAAHRRQALAIALERPDTGMMPAWACALAALCGVFLAEWLGTRAYLDALIEWVAR